MQDTSGIIGLVWPLLLALLLLLRHGGSNSPLPLRARRGVRVVVGAVYPSAAYSAEEETVLVAAWGG